MAAFSYKDKKYRDKDYNIIDITFLAERFNY